MSEDVGAERPDDTRSIRMWATRSAAVIGLFLAFFYLAVIIGQDDGLSAAPILWFAAMLSAGLAAWFADRVVFDRGRKMAISAMVIFLLIGVLAIFTIGVVFLLAAILSLLGFAGVRAPNTGG